MLKELLDQRELLPILQMNGGQQLTPELWTQRRAEMLDALCRYSYGFMPPCPGPGTGRVTEELGNAYAGKVTEQTVSISFPTPSGAFGLEVKLFIPKAQSRPPVFLNLAFRPVPDRYIPVEEITDRGFALCVLCYKDVVNDKHFGDYSDGLARAFGTDNPRSPEEWGKIGMWAYGASRVLDYLLTREDLDASRTAVVGHSRLGKTALWTAAQDERFWCACSNDSGYGGAASSKHGTGERVDDFLRCGSWDWFCENFKLYRGEREDSKPYDQAYLLALIAPRLLLVGSAEKDRGADPLSEFLTTLHASAAWKLLGEKGLVTPDRLPLPGEQLNDGNPCYHLRPHQHFFSRQDWNAYMDTLNKKLNRDL